MTRKLTKDQAEKKPITETKDKKFDQISKEALMQLEMESAEQEANQLKAVSAARMKVGMDFNYKAAFELVIAHYYEVSAELDEVTESNEDVRDVMTSRLEIIEKELKECIEMKAFYA